MYPGSQPGDSNGTRREWAGQQPLEAPSGTSGTIRPRRSQGTRVIQSVATDKFPLMSSYHFLWYVSLTGDPHILSSIKMIFYVIFVPHAASYST